MLRSSSYCSVGFSYLFRPMGELVNTINNDGRQFEVYKCEESTPRFRDYHERLQTWIMFYIDAASFIDIDDDNWKMFLMFEKTGGPGSESYSIVGYITVYQYYAYGRDTNMMRPRISQMLVLPPFQRQGLGSQLLETVYRCANPIPNNKTHNVFFSFVFCFQELFER